MDVVTRISLLFTLCGNGYAKNLNPTIIVQGINVTVHIDRYKTDGKTLREINFSGYTSNQHFTNVVLYIPVNGHQYNISINRNYTGRINSVVTDNFHSSFLLLNVNFNDSGIYIVKENSNVIGNTTVLVASRTVLAQLWEPIELSFIVYAKNTSSIRVDNPASKLNQPIVIYNATNDSCIYTDVASVEKKHIQNCLLRKGEFLFTIPEIGWLHKGSYFAWDDKGRLLDSIFLDIQEKTTTVSAETRSSLYILKQKETWLIISALGITILAACVVVVAVWKLRIRRAGMNGMHDNTCRNGIQTIGYRSSNAFIPEETVIVLTKNNSKNLTELKRNKFQARVKHNDQNMCAQELGCSKSYSNTRCNLQTDSSLSSAETIQSQSAHGYDYVHDCDELASDCQSKQTYIRSKFLDTKSIGSTSQSSFEYNYAVQRRFMTLRPPAPEPVVKKKNKQQNMVDNSFYSHKKVNKKSLPIHDPSILFAKKNNQRSKECHRTRSSDELCLDFVNVVSSPRFVQLEKDFEKKAVDSPSRQVKCLNSKVFACRQEPSRFRDSKTRRASQSLRVDYPRDDYDHAYAMERRLWRSWSNDALYGDLMFTTKVPLSRRFSASTCMDEDYYDCLNNSSFNT